MDKDILLGPKDELTAEIVTVALNAIPVVGGIVSGTAMFFLERTKNERLNRFLYQVAEDLQSLQGEINNDFIKREEFRDLVEDVFTKASETRQQEKLDALRSVFLFSVTSVNPQYEEIEEITSLIQTWGSSHIKLLMILENPEAINERMGIPIKEHRGGMVSLISLLRVLLPDWDDYKIERMWQNLYDNHIHNTPSIKSSINDRGIIQLKDRLTPFGKRVTDFLKYK